MLTIDSPPHDVVGSTIAELSRRLDWAPWLETRATGLVSRQVAAACAAWDPAELDLVAGRTGPETVLLPAGVRSSA
jgi:hypothetical protein